MVNKVVHYMNLRNTRIGRRRVVINVFPGYDTGHCDGNGVGVMLSVALQDVESYPRRGTLARFGLGNPSEAEQQRAGARSSGRGGQR